MRQLEANHESFEAADHQKDHGGDKVAEADDFVVDRCEGAPQAFRGFPDFYQLLFGARRGQFNSFESNQNRYVTIPLSYLLGWESTTKTVKR
jgi:hypothetical protein